MEMELKQRVCTLNFIELLIESVAKRVVEKLKEEKENWFPRTIPVEAEAVSEDTSNRLLKIDEVCKLLNVSRVTLYNWRRQKILQPDTYVGTSPRYFQSTIDNYIQNKK